jgi:hypothetical protein
MEFQQLPGVCAVADSGNVSRAYERFKKGPPNRSESAQSRFRTEVSQKSFIRPRP